MDPLEAPHKTFLEKFGPSLFIGFVALLPLFLMPAVTLPFMVSKAFLVYAAAFVFLILWIVDCLKQGSIRIPRSPVLILSGALVVVYAVSAIFSALPIIGIIGHGYELDTTLSLLALTVLLFLVPQYFRTRESIFNFYIGLFASFGLVFLFSVIKLMAGASAFTWGGVLTTVVSNVVGSWNDLGIFAGLVSVLSLIMLEVVPPRGALKWLLYGALVLSLLLLSVVNFLTVWYVLAFLSFAVVVYVFTFAPSFSPEEGNGERRGFARLPKTALIVFLFAILFSVTGSDMLGASHPGMDIGSNISQSLGISQLEARPSWGTTFGIAEQTLHTSPLIGVGPNQFVYEWMKYRPKVVNESAFWNIEFNYGIGIIPSTLVSVGLVGILAWILFLGLFAYKGLRSLRTPRGDLFSYYLSVTSFVGASYLWVMATIYTVSFVPFALAFILTGLFLASMVLSGGMREKVVMFSEEPASRFVVLISSGVITLVVIAGLFMVFERMLALHYFNRALITFNKSNDLATAEIDVRKAISIYGDDAYYRGLSQIALANLNSAASKITAQTPPDQIRSQFQLLLGGAIAAAQAARDVNPEYYQNWISLGQAYESVVPLKIAGAYDNAKAAYEDAMKRNPTNPQIALTLARLDVLNNDAKSAKVNLEKALALKSNYTDAIYLLSQIQVAEGDLTGAIRSVESAATLNPNDATTFFELGFLYYNQKSYDKARLALERAVALESTYANARYFLGLSYDTLGQKDKAVEQFEAIEKTNPDNQEVQFILDNLKAGRAAFQGVQPPLDNAPEKRKKPPVSEESKVIRTGASETNL